MGRGGTGGTVYVRATADVSVFDESAFCPCRAILTIVNLDTGDFAPESVFVVPADLVDGVSAATGSVSWVFAVPSGVAQEFALDAIVFPSTPEPLGTDGVPEADAQVWGNLTVEYVPFGSTVEFVDVTSTLPDRFQQQVERLHAR